MTIVAITPKNKQYSKPRTLVRGSEAITSVTTHKAAVLNQNARLVTNEDQQNGRLDKMILLLLGGWINGLIMVGIVCHCKWDFNRWGKARRKRYRLVVFWSALCGRVD